MASGRTFALFQRSLWMSPDTGLEGGVAVAPGVGDATAGGEGGIGAIGSSLQAAKHKQKTSKK